MNEWERNRRLAEPTRKAYPPGTRILLNHMDDPRDPVRAGMRGTVRFVDDQSQIHIQWDNGRGLALIPGVDSFRKLTQEELVQECVPLQKGIFCIVEEDGCFEGYTTGKTWNGWVQPLFEKDTAEKVCAKYLGGQQAKTVYDRERNSFVVDDHELGMAYEYEGSPIKSTARSKSCTLSAPANGAGTMPKGRIWPVTQRRTQRWRRKTGRNWECKTEALRWTPLWNA